MLIVSFNDLWSVILPAVVVFIVSVWVLLHSNCLNMHKEFILNNAIHNQVLSILYFENLHYCYISVLCHLCTVPLGAAISVSFGQFRSYSCCSKIIIATLTYNSEIFMICFPLFKLQNKTFQTCFRLQTVVDIRPLSLFTPELNSSHNDKNTHLSCGVCSWSFILQRPWSLSVWVQVCIRCWLKRVWVFVVFVCCAMTSHHSSIFVILALWKLFLSIILPQGHYHYWGSALLTTM